jgi:type IX secretion system PorP/SprF family membrane protein
MMKKIVTPILYICALGWLHAQQLPQYSLYMLNPYALNPAVAGTENTLMLNGVYRQQWSDLRGAPVGQSLNAHLPVYRINSGLGLRLDNDAVGAHRTTQIALSYAFQLELGRSALLSLGVSGGYMQYALDGAKLRAPQGTYSEPGGLFTHNDDLLPEGSINAGTAFGEAGIYFRRKALQAGLAVQPVFAPVLEPTSGGAFRLKPARHYLFTAGYSLPIGDDLEFKPSFLAKTDFSVTQLEISALFNWRSFIFAGASLRGATRQARDAAVVLIGWQINERSTAAYAYDLPLSALRAVNRGSHELMLRYSLNKPVGRGTLPPVIYNPRFW